jgi:hypothetical protein
VKKAVVCAGAALTAIAGIVLLTRDSSQPKAIARSALRSANVTEAASHGSAPKPLRVGGHEASLPIQTHAVQQDRGLIANPFVPPRWAPRAPDEWQGMLVDLNVTPPCNTMDGCGLARACIDNKCMPCDIDAQCASGKACVLQHCVSRELVGCRHASECGEHSKCVLSGYSSESRGSEGMSSSCVSNFSGASTLPPRARMDERHGAAPPRRNAALAEAARAAQFE